MLYHWQYRKKSVAGYTHQNSKTTAERKHPRQKREFWLCGERARKPILRNDPHLYRRFQISKETGWWSANPKQTNKYHSRQEYSHHLRSRTFCKLLPTEAVSLPDSSRSVLFCTTSSRPSSYFPTFIFLVIFIFPFVFISLHCMYHYNHSIFFF